MNIVMSYIDYNMAGIGEREVFSCTKTQMEEIYHKLAAKEEILGAVLLATCNRTELYLSLTEESSLNPFRELCQMIGADYEKYAFMNKTLHDRDVIGHLCKVAAGAESMIWGDDQIVTQVDDALKTAQRLKAADAVLNVMFRNGVSAGKKVKTLVDFKVDDNSTAAKAVNILKENPDFKNVLVIGNGMIGRLVAELLVKEGFRATMTLRQYKHGENIVPDGVETIGYNDRYAVIGECDAVISATLSPHYTLQYEEIKKLPKAPAIMIDLAVPRDIDPEIEAHTDIKCYDVDDISRESRNAKQEEQMKQIEEIIQKYVGDFYKWNQFRIGIALKGIG